MSELLNFSSMSDDQINEAINNAGKELDMYIPNLEMEDQSALDWLVSLYYLALPSVKSPCFAATLILTDPLRIGSIWISM